MHARILRISAVTMGNALASLPGQIRNRCGYNDCIVYDSNGRCVKTIRSCTWDFDCSCK